MYTWVNIKTDKGFANLRGQSPLIKALLRPDADLSLLERIFSNGITTPTSPEEKKQVVAEKTKKVVEWRDMLDKKFFGRPEDKAFCLRCLGHLISAHYSGKAQSLGAIEWTLERLSNAITDKQPIIFTFCFGGYKSHTSPSHPEVDWAELFNLNYLVSYLYPIINEYKYGVRIEYESEEVSIQFNNVPQEKTDRYTASFTRLLDYYKRTFSKKFGIQLNLSLILARDSYEEGAGKLYELMEAKKSNYLKIFEELPEETKKKWVQRAASNYMWENGIKKYENLSESERHAIIVDARINNEAFLEADYELRGSWFEYKYRIPITGTWGRMPSAQPIDGWLHIKSTANSLVDCWIGTGFLEAEHSNGSLKYSEAILSKTQIEEIREPLGYLENLDEELRRVSSNFNRVPVYNRKEAASAKIP